MIPPLDKPRLPEGATVILYGNLAPEGAVAKITGKEGLQFSGPARVFDSEEEMLKARLNKIAYIPQGAMNSLNPVMRIHDQMADVILAHEGQEARSGLDDRIGSLEVGKQADLVVFSDMKKPVIEQVYCQGILTAENGKIRAEVQFPATGTVAPAMHIDVQNVDFSMPAEQGRIRVIEIVSDQLITRQRIEATPVKNHQAVSEPSKDLLKIAVVERHRGTGNIGRGYIKGFGLKQGALASSVAHDSHNIIVVGTADEDMQAALEAVVEMGGGLAAVSNGRLLAGLALPIAGLMSLEPVRTVRDQLERLIEIAHELGTTLQDPFMTLSFMALPVIPELKLTDMGLIDVSKFEIVPLFVA